MDEGHNLMVKTSYSVKLLFIKHEINAVVMSFFFFFLGNNAPNSGVGRFLIPSKGKLSHVLSCECFSS